MLKKSAEYDKMYCSCEFQENISFENIFEDKIKNTLSQ